MQQHRLWNEKTDKYKFNVVYDENNPIPVQAGVQVDGTHSSQVGFVDDVVKYAYSLGALSPEVYEDFQALVHAAHRGDVPEGLDYLDEVLDFTVENLNMANLTDNYTWGVYESDLHYQSQGWWTS
jgi:hypothetical protein